SVRPPREPLRGGAPHRPLTAPPGSRRLRRTLSRGARVRAPAPGSPARGAPDPDRIDRGTHAGAARGIRGPVERVLPADEDPPGRRRPPPRARRPRLPPG